MSRLKPMIVAVVFGSLFAGGASLALQAPAAAQDEKPAAKFEVYKDRSGEFRWRLRATNTQILATSGDAYKAKRDCLHAIESVKRAAANAPVEELGDRQGTPGGENKAGAAETPANAKRPAR